jgi:membrane-bound serine protease (ClpP class)
MHMLVMMLVMLFPLVGLALFYFLPLRAALPLYLAGLAASAFLHHAMRRAMRLQARTGREGMVGREAVVLSWAGDRGWVRCGPERWQAITRHGETVRAGGAARVVAVDGLTLVVEPLKRA